MKWGIVVVLDVCLLEGRSDSCVLKFVHDTAWSLSVCSLSISWILFISSEFKGDRSIIANLSEWEVGGRTHCRVFCMCKMAM